MIKLINLIVYGFILWHFSSFIANHYCEFFKINNQYKIGLANGVIFAIFLIALIIFLYGQEKDEKND